MFHPTREPAHAVKRTQHSAVGHFLSTCQLKSVGYRLGWVYKLMHFFPTKNTCHLPCAVCPTKRFWLLTKRHRSNGLQICTGVDGVPNSCIVCPNCTWYVYVWNSSQLSNYCILFGQGTRVFQGVLTLLLLCSVIAYRATVEKLDIGIFALSGQSCSCLVLFNFTQNKDP